ncbi:hypothetical protein C8F04DRAFT_1139587 [Mycena alexandri]|uniref:DUF6533 domain-containing protein n=1 Tax=Mycena alexandri TaxID=1745969 RepID=A0AAD6S7X7_9AGAR|nr:hypothetical protein C8F04DRAFT_1139587 [Mycena alexandri]
MTSKAIYAATNHFLQFRLQYSSLAFIYYDFALTLPKEVQYIWKERFRLSTALYIGCRYALVANILYLLAIAGQLGSTCDLWYKVVGALSILGRAAVITVFTLRTYAVYGQNKWILAYMGTVGLACVALDITHVPGMRCVGSSRLPMSPEMLSILMVVFEASSAFLTTLRCIVAFRAGGLKYRRHGIMVILFEQGILYFCTISIFTTTAVILNYRAPPGFLQRLPNAFTLPLSCVLTARFILYLREWDAEQMGNKGRATDLTAVDSSTSTQLGVISTVLAVEDFGADPVALGAMGHEEGLIFPPNKTGSTDIIGAAGGFGRRSSESLEYGYALV